MAAMKRTVFILLMAVSLGGCAAQVTSSGSLEVCRGGRCAPAREMVTKAELADTLYEMFRTSATYGVCDANGRTCKDKDISFFVQGGPIPGRGTVEALEGSSVTLDRDKGQIRLGLTYRAAFIGVSTVCERSDSVITVTSLSDVQIESTGFYCNWLLVGNAVMNARYAIDFIDIDRGVLGGHYAMGVVGILAGGSGTGEFILDVKRGGAGLASQDTAPMPPVARAKKATLATVPQGGAAQEPLPAPVAASPPPPSPAGKAFTSAPVVTRFPKGGERPDDIAVIIGNADYAKQGRDIPDVKPAYADAEGIRLYVLQALGIKEGNIIILKDATGAQMTRVFGSKEEPRGQLFDWVKPGQKSRVFVYYSGHGAPGRDGGSPYLVPTDADAARIELNGYPVKQLYDNLGKLPAESVTVVLEACFSGLSPAGSVLGKASPVFFEVKAPPVPANLTVITAGAANQVASWDTDESASLFTRNFLEGMAGKADLNHDGKVTLDELDRYLKDTLTYYARRYYGRDQQAQIIRGGGP